MNTQPLIETLRNKIRGEVRFDAGSRALYATDASNYRQVPVGVVIPQDTEDIIQTIALCREFDVPVLTRGGGTSLCGQCCNAAVVIDLSKYVNKILEINPEKKIARVEPGVILDELREAAGPYGLTFGPDPATHSRCTLGGMIGNNACGVHSVVAGKTVDNVEALEILTFDGLRMRVGKTTDQELQQMISEGGRRGEIYAKLKTLRDQYADLIRKRYPKIPRRVSGYNLDELLPENGFHVARALVGTEGTCVTVLEAALKLIHIPPVRSLLVLGYPDIFAAADDVVSILAHQPVGLEGLDQYFVQSMKKKGLHLREIPLLPEGESWLLVEFGGESPEEAREKAHQLASELQKRSHAPAIRQFDQPDEQKLVWSVRESSFGASVFVPGEKDTFAGWEDSAVPPAKLGDYLRNLRKLMDQYQYGGFIYGHFGDGCIHARITFDLQSDQGIQKYRSFVHEAADLVIGYGGSLSGEHGDGQAYAELLPKMFGTELVKAFGEFKAIWDPRAKMNPGKVVNAYRMDENLRLGTEPAAVRPQQSAPPLHFQFPEDNGDFARTSLRCIGIGKCRRLEGETMCPSFMVTREEQHSTRGRAHLLYEMMRGEVITGGWRDEHVKESLDLCLACKGCKNECPVNVDMAAYKAEFLSHYYEGRMRPLSAYAFGLISQWAHLAEAAPYAANFFTQTPGLKDIAKCIAGVAPQRDIPAFALQTFKQWFRQRELKNQGSPQVILWPDTFNNFFYPKVAQDAVEILERLGFQVIVPQEPLCCGRPLYDYGMLDLAKGRLRQILQTLRGFLTQGVPVIGLEPSCITVFRDELLNLFPHDAEAKLLSQQAFLFSEFLEKNLGKIQFPKLSRKALVHGHCHQKAVMGMESEAKVLSQLGLDFHTLDSGCCGMAGAFGFEKKHYEISVKIGEQVLLPAVRQAAPDTLIMTNGFSCREQIAQLTPRRPLHLAEVVHMALFQ